MYLQRHKRMKTSNDEDSFVSAGPLPYNHGNNHVDQRERSHNIASNNDVSALPKILEGLAKDKYGSVTKEYEKLHVEHTKLMHYLYTVRSSLTSRCTNRLIDSRAGSDTCDASSRILEEQRHLETREHEVDLEVNDSALVVLSSIEEKDKCGDNCQRTKEGAGSKSIIVIDSDEEDQQCQIMCHDIGTTKVDANLSVAPNYLPSVQYHHVVLTKATKIKSSEEIEVNYADNDGGHSIRPLNVKMRNVVESDVGTQSNSDPVNLDDSLSTGRHQEDDFETPDSDGLEDLWNERLLALEYSKVNPSDCSAASTMVENGSEDCDHDYLPKDDVGLACQICGDIKKSCDHDYLLKDDIGLVCRICGVIKKSITTIFDYQWRKGSQTTRTYISGSRKSKDTDEEIHFLGPNLSEADMISGELSLHPRHLKQMKAHQIEGFNFLVRNLVGDKPGGCILAHAPGSGKTFMLISFIQSFLAKYPSARPLIILPKGILPTWKREFKRWQVEDIPLHDFYSVKADNRSQQLDVLKEWENNRSILFLGYKQFSRIICDVKDKIGAACQERLLKIPSLLILDEGHTPRNEDTNILSTLEKVQTPRKVVLSGTLFQNHVKEVFNILNLVRRKFLKRESSRDAMRRILSRASISGGSRRHLKADAEAAFFDLVEETLQSDDHKRRISVIQDLREMTKDVLHYYKGDFLDELPGYTDFTVLLNLSPKQKRLLGELGNYEKFKRVAVGSALYLHPCLKDCADFASGDRVKVKDEEIDELLNSIDLKDGVKTKFLLNILTMADSHREKVLVFSQYILPLRFLERLIIRIFGWRSGKETFMISGDTNTEQREWAMEQFNNSHDAKILFGSIKACGEGISLVGASRVIILDVHLNPSVSRQAIGRAFRPGQMKKVYTYRLVAADSPEERDHGTCFRKELISKMWFEWSEYCRQREFELEMIDIQDCQDIFLTHLLSVEDIVSLYRR